MKASPWTDRPVLFDATPRTQFEDRDRPDDWTCGVGKEEDAWHAAAHGKMFGAFDANRPDAYRWDVVSICCMVHQPGNVITYHRSRDLASTRPTTTEAR